MLMEIVVLWMLMLVSCCMLVVVFFFKQKTAYEMRISDWSSDVCSSDLQKVYPADVQLIFPVAGRGRPRQHHVPDTASRAAHAVLDDAKWRQISWRRGTKGRLSARFAVMRVRIADGPPQRIGA